MLRFGFSLRLLFRLPTIDPLSSAYICCAKLGPLCSLCTLSLTQLLVIAPRFWNTHARKYNAMIVASIAFNLHSNPRTFWKNCVSFDRWHSKIKNEPIAFHLHDVRAPAEFPNLECLDPLKIKRYAYINNQLNLLHNIFIVLFNLHSTPSIVLLAISW